LTHAHIDHIGRIPDLIDAVFDGEIICTDATKALLIPMFHDALFFTDRDKGAIARMKRALTIFHESLNSMRPSP
jgi:metallo-beta-lactamase family protein